ncbi:MAG: hypothetical protein ACREIA_22065 [Opitutaceae bacterium]
MFKRISPQKVQHSTGYFVQVLDRETIEYIDGGTHVTVQVDFGPTVGVYKQTLRKLERDGGQSGLLSEDDRERFFGRIVDGLNAMGCAVEIC